MTWRERKRLRSGSEMAASQRIPLSSKATRGSEGQPGGGGERAGGAGQLFESHSGAAACVPWGPWGPCGCSL